MHMETMKCPHYLTCRHPPSHHPRCRRKGKKRSSTPKKRLFNEVVNELFDRYLDSCINMNDATAELAESQKRHLEVVAELKRKKLEVDLMVAELQKKQLEAEIRQISQI